MPIVVARDPLQLRGHRQRAVPRGVRGAQAGPHHVLCRVMGARARRGPRFANADRDRLSRRPRAGGAGTSS